MRKLIFLNGCINAGKTTVANRLKSAVENLAHVEVDDLHAFISWMPIGEAIHLNLENAILVTKTFINAGIDVVFTYPLSRNDYSRLVERLSGTDTMIIPITLFTPRDNAKTNRGNRSLTEWELNRIEWMHENGLADPKTGTLIDNTQLSVEETVEKVIEIAALDRKRI